MRQVGLPFSYSIFNFGTLPGSFNLLAIGNRMSASQFNAALSTTPPAPGEAPNSFNALWTWDAQRSKWYFYTPQFEQPGSALTNSGYAAAHGYQDFGGGTPPAPALSLQPGIGFWVEKF